MSHESNDRATDTTADVEQAVSDAPLGKEKGARFDSPVRIHIHSIRKRTADPDGISAKAAIDGIVKGGLLEDDSAKHVEAVTYSQEKGSEEKTLITVESADMTFDELIEGLAWGYQ